ncbi:MAG: septum formation initiator family protein [Lachnospiraceae bacterium]|nr:septum formation initiator family protein [Candidatus Darwinimomas equi]
MALIAVIAVVTIFGLVLGVRMKSLKAKEQQYIEKEQAILARVAEEEERAKTLEEYRVYVQTKQYVEKVAKEKLGLVNPDEILLKPSEE